MDSSFRALSRLGQLHPHARPAHHGVTVLRDVPYQAGGAPAHTLDIYLPPSSAKAPAGPLPVVLYIHGGGFRILSKDSHWLMGLAFARRGYVVFNINYRLAPQHPYPAALIDCCAALGWVHDHARDYGGDPSRLVLAGESAGANLVTALAVATSYRRPEPWAQALFARDIRPRAALPICGILQVSDTARFARRRPLRPFVLDRLREVSEAYLGHEPTGPAGLYDPLLVLEEEQPERGLPPFFTAVGTLDPLLDDTRRLKAALDRLGVPCEAHYHEGEVHAFHALVWRANARRCWRDSFAFLDRCWAEGVGGASSGSGG